MKVISPFLWQASGLRASAAEFQCDTPCATQPFEPNRYLFPPRRFSIFAAKKINFQGLANRNPKGCGRRSTSQGPLLTEALHDCTRRRTRRQPKASTGTGVTGVCDEEARTSVAQRLLCWSYCPPQGFSRRRFSRRRPHPRHCAAAYRRTPAGPTSRGRSSTRA